MSIVKVKPRSKLIYQQDDYPTDRDFLPHGIKSLEDGLTVDHLKSAFPWLLSALIKDAVLGLNHIGYLNWYSGEWLNGFWHDGLWQSGTWHTGLWQRGMWSRGIWHSGTREHGAWHSGSWHSGRWTYGDWYSGTWHNGSWFNGTWCTGNWYSGTWRTGAIQNNITGDLEYSNTPPSKDHI